MECDVPPKSTHKLYAYPSIANVDNTRVLDKIATTTAWFHPDEPWILTEKVHGANIAFVVHRSAPREARIQRRSDFLSSGESFHGVITDKKIAVVRAAVCDMFEQEAILRHAEQITVFGELYGQGVQKFHYTNYGVHFVCFDLLIDSTFVSYEVLSRLCRGWNIPFAQTLVEGSFANLRACVDVETLHSWYPKMHDSVLADRPPTIAEGIVLRPKRFTATHEDAKLLWPVFKLKRRAFQERSAQVAATENEAVALALEFVTAPRLDNVRSKLPQDARLDAIARTYVGDAMEEIEQEDFYLGLSSDGARRKLKQAVTKAAWKLIKEGSDVTENEK